MKKNNQKLLDFLAKNSNKTFTKKSLEEKLLKIIQINKRNKENTNLIYKKKKKNNPSKNNSLEMINQFLEEMSQFKLLIFQKDKVTIKEPFLVEARLSISKKGLAFGICRPTDILITPRNRGDAGHRDTVLIQLIQKSDKGYEGRVIEVINKFTNIFIAKVIEKQRKQYLISLPDLPDAPFGVLQNSQHLQENEYLVVKELTSLESKSIAIHSSKDKNRNKGRERKKYYEAKQFELIEKIDLLDPLADVKRIEIKFNLPIDYSKIKNISQIISRKKMEALYQEGLNDNTRKNLVKLYSFTIDGEDARDFDDAISIEEKKDETILYVHIADVSHFVKKGSALEEEAFKRCNSYYLRKKVIPMLPEILSEKYCSLNPNTRRLAFTCEMHFNKKNEIINYQFYKSIIYLNKRYTYKTAEEELKQNNKNSVLAPVWKLTQKLIDIREKNGKIDLDIPELAPVFDDKENIIALKSKERLQSHRLVEECMLSANTCAANFTRENQLESIYRVHEAIPEDAIDKINSFLKLYGYKKQFKDLSYKNIKKAIELVTEKEIRKLKNTKNIKQENEITIANIFQYILLRSFSQAIYSIEPNGHWGLAFKDYTHFTSPIRRFSDLVVHRVIDAKINQIYSTEELLEIAEETSRLERVAMEAERAMYKLLGLRLMREDIGKTFDAFFTGFNNNGLFVQILDPPIEGFIDVKSFSFDKRIESIDDFQVVIPKFHKSIHLGSKIKVVLKKVDWENIRIDFELTKL